MHVHRAAIPAMHRATFPGKKRFGHALKPALFTVLP